MRGFLFVLRKQTKKKKKTEIAAVLIEGCLLRDSFEMSFLSWSVTIRWRCAIVIGFFLLMVLPRWTFYQVVAAAVAERPEWKSMGGGFFPLFLLNF